MTNPVTITLQMNYSFQTPDIVSSLWNPDPLCLHLVRSQLPVWDLGSQAAVVPQIHTQKHKSLLLSLSLIELVQNRIRMVTCQDVRLFP